MNSLQTLSKDVTASIAMPDNYTLQPPQYSSSLCSSRTPSAPSSLASESDDGASSPIPHASSCVTSDSRTDSRPHKPILTEDPLLAPGNGRKKRIAHTKEAISLLKDWLLSEEHVHNPYPTEAEKKILMQRTGLDKKQLTNWFTNARKRIWQPRYGPTPKSKKGDIPDVNQGKVDRTDSNQSECSIQSASSVPIKSQEAGTKAAVAQETAGTSAPAAAAVVTSEHATPLQRKRDRTHPPTLDPMTLDAGIDEALALGSEGTARRLAAAAFDPSPRGPKTPRLEPVSALTSVHGATNEYHLSSNDTCPTIPTSLVVTTPTITRTSTPDAELRTNLFDFQDMQRFNDAMLNPLSPVNGFEHTLGSPVESVWLESSH